MPFHLLPDVVREVGDFSLGVAAFPEVHPRSPDRESDRRLLAEKLAQADFAITQMFFRVEDYLRLRDRAYVDGYERWFAARAFAQAGLAPPAAYELWLVWPAITA